MEIDKDLKTKFEKFRNDRRAYTSFLILLTLFVITFPAEFLCNVRPIVLSLDGKLYFPILFQYDEKKDFGGTLPGEPDYKSNNFKRLLQGLPAVTGGGIDLSDFEEERETGIATELQDFEEEPSSRFTVELEDFEDESPSIRSDVPKKENDAASGIKETIEETPSVAPRKYWMLWPPVRYDYKHIPVESKTGRVVLAAPYETKDGRGNIVPSSWEDGHYLGTDDRGRDVLARLIYGFRISMIFGLSLAVTGTIIGCLIGGIQGFFGGWVDLIGQRLTEIWGSMPRLYILIILSSFLVPSAAILFVILNLTAWMGIAAYIRAEFLKVRNYYYVKAAKALGVSNFKIMRSHILPNSLTPVITFFPFEVTAGILALVSLDYLNLGVPSPAPSIGELLAQGKNNLQATWIILPTFLVLTLTLSLLTFFGEGIRNAFDPMKSLK